ncbi:Glutamate receptor ionotropic, kainate glr-3 [Frankliniella fusca]|uniref:Glutamate receptor ionotropic, kainate glr-3 n=1 Tax=Frankliniella fusca TaxID=407009 RepID=A0AAE1LFR3_9NEOP|nr:Glutamate receptor ionotropic, kainate glr-3 [Frankliniella fusca]
MTFVRTEEVDMPDINEECENVCNLEFEEAMFSSAVVRIKQGRNCANLSIDHIVNLFENYRFAISVSLFPLERHSWEGDRRKTLKPE